jgi:hypothetical protein
MTYYLKFPNEKTALSKLKSAGFINEDKEIINASQNCLLEYLCDII